MEQLEIHSRSYIVRWVSVKDNDTIQWTVRPDKKSINFALFKHPGSGSGIAPPPRLPSSTHEAPPSPGLLPITAANAATTAPDTSSKAVAKLQASGLKLVQWYGSYEANHASTESYDVPPAEGGHYALVFDNTFSKQHSKRATLVLLTYPTNTPPRVDLHTQQQVSSRGLWTSTSSKEIPRPRNNVGWHSSTDLSRSALDSDGVKEGNRPRSSSHISSTEPSSNIFSGNLQKRRRRRGQGWARRFFSLDFRTSTLTYYHDRGTSSIRGAMPILLAAVGANVTTRQISIDSGAEVWHLKASSQKDFQDWKEALERAHVPSTPNAADGLTKRFSFRRRNTGGTHELEDQHEWARADEILSRLKGSRDLTLALAKDTDPKYHMLSPPQPLDTLSGRSSASGSPSEHSLNGYFEDRSRDRRPFWKRKPSSDQPMPGSYQRSVSATPSIPTSHCNTVAKPTLAALRASDTSANRPDGGYDVHEKCMSLLKDLDTIVKDFDLLRKDCKNRREHLASSSLSKHSNDSDGEEFFDAEAMNGSMLLDIHDVSSDDDASDRASVSSSESSNESRVGRRLSVIPAGSERQQEDLAFPNKPTNLIPLPSGPIRRRDQVRRPLVTPPSLIGFLRKNVGKDLSTISMPVSANEPLSLLQRAAEALEYSKLLDCASSAPSSVERLLFVAAFAVSQLSSSRVRERTVRKPFNPMLGETFELVREDRDFRFLAEKVSHHPVQLAYQAESSKWTVTQSPMPSQKFWGKSVELLTEGKVRIVLHTTNERFTFNPATSFLRNIIAGEKYMEPTGTMVVVNETTAEKAVITFKAGGMFSGRSEDISGVVHDAYGKVLVGPGLDGKWTQSLRMTDEAATGGADKIVWEANNLVPEAAKRYGFTVFAAGLNETTELEQGKTAPTDSRLRPDQRALEDGDVDNAENVKAKLEEAQRRRRREQQSENIEWQPRWFEKVKAADGDSVWVQKQGDASYWSKRAIGDWKISEPIFDL